MSNIDKADKLRLLDHAATPGPWHYRPEKYDDWGFIRASRTDEDAAKGLGGWPVATMRSGSHLDREKMDEHRKAGTDPYGPNSEIVVFLRNNVDLFVRLLAESEWRDIATAKKDRTVIWARLRDDIGDDKEEGSWKEDLKRWRGLQVPLRHPGLAEDGFDAGWNIAAPVGVGGFPDEWIAGWRPMPE